MLRAKITYMVRNRTVKAADRAPEGSQSSQGIAAPVLRELRRLAAFFREFSEFSE